jgi:hypothetical protein
MYLGAARHAISTYIGYAEQGLHLDILARFLGSGTLKAYRHRGWEVPNWHSSLRMAAHNESDKLDFEELKYNVRCIVLCREMSVI